METPTKLKQEPKEPYSTPKLTIYGTIEHLTKQVGTMGDLDGATTGPTKTQL